MPTAEQQQQQQLDGFRTSFEAFMREDTGTGEGLQPIDVYTKMALRPDERREWRALSESAIRETVHELYATFAQAAPVAEPNIAAPEKRKRGRIAGAVRGMPAHLKNLDTDWRMDPQFPGYAMGRCGTYVRYMASHKNAKLQRLVPQILVRKGCGPEYVFHLYVDGKQVTRYMSDAAFDTGHSRFNSRAYRLAQQKKARS